MFFRFLKSSVIFSAHLQATILYNSASEKTFFIIGHSSSGIKFAGTGSYWDLSNVLLGEIQSPKGEK